MSRIKICIIPLLLVIATSINAQNYREWDQDQDGYITDYEFQVQLEDHEYFGNFDLNSDGRIDESEWEATCKDCDFLVKEYHRDWDINRDSYVSEKEFIQGAYVTWDNDEDGYIANREYEDHHEAWGLIK